MIGGLIMRIDVDIPEGTLGDYQIAHYNNDTTDYNWQTYRKL